MVATLALMSRKDFYIWHFDRVALHRRREHARASCAAMAISAWPLVGAKIAFSCPKLAL
jgi:hypothetical protein